MDATLKFDHHSSPLTWTLRGGLPFPGRVTAFCHHTFTVLCVLPAHYAHGRQYSSGTSQLRRLLPLWFHPGLQTTFRTATRHSSRTLILLPPCPISIFYRYLPTATTLFWFAHTFVWVGSATTILHSAVTVLFRLVWTLLPTCPTPPTPHYTYLHTHTHLHTPHYHTPRSTHPTHTPGLDPAPPTHRRDTTGRTDMLPDGRRPGYLARFYCLAGHHYCRTWTARTSYLPTTHLPLPLPPRHCTATSTTHPASYILPPPFPNATTATIPHYHTLPLANACCCRCCRFPGVFCTTAHGRVVSAVPGCGSACGSPWRSLTCIPPHIRYQFLDVLQHRHHHTAHIHGTTGGRLLHATRFVCAP